MAESRPEDCCPEGGSHGGSAGALRTAFLITLLLFLVEVAGGLWTGSLALLADSAHMAVDLASLGLSLFAAWAASVTPGGGPVARRIEVKAALANGVLLWLVVGVLLREALQRWREPRDILVGPMLAVAVAGLAANLLSAYILHRGAKENLNLRGAFLHVLSDALGSVGVIVGGLVVATTGRPEADPLATVCVCVVILFASWRLIADSVRFLLDQRPQSTL